MIERSARDIVEKLKTYGSDPNTLEALADFMVFMGLPEGYEFAAQAAEELAQAKADEKAMRRAYTEHLRQGIANYMPYEKFKEKKSAGLL